MMAAEDDNSNHIHTACTANNITAWTVNNVKNNSARLITIDSQNPYIATYVTEVQHHVPQSDAAADVGGTLHPHLPRGGKSTIQQIPEAAADVDGILNPHVPRGGKNTLQQIPEAAADVDGVPQSEAAANVDGTLHPHLPRGGKSTIQQISEAAADVDGILHPHVPVAVKVLYNKFLRPQPMSMVSCILMYPVAIKVLVIQQILEAAADVTT